VWLDEAPAPAVYTASSVVTKIVVPKANDLFVASFSSSLAGKADDPKIGSHAEYADAVISGSQELTKQSVRIRTGSCGLGGLRTIS
jgi:hypothetical protein